MDASRSVCRKPLEEVRPVLEQKLKEAAGTDVYVWYNYAAGTEDTARHFRPCLHCGISACRTN